MRVPGPRLCHTGIMWLWHEDGLGPAVFRIDPRTATWEGLVSSVKPGTVLGQGWSWCEGSSGTAQPRDLNCLMLLNQVSWEGYPRWFFDMYTSMGGSSR